MLRYALIVAILSMPTAALARPANTVRASAVMGVSATPASVCTRVRRKAFHLPEGWSVKTVALACKTMTAAIHQSDNKIFTSLRSINIKPVR